MNQAPARRGARSVSGCAPRAWPWSRWSRPVSCRGLWCPWLGCPWLRCPWLQGAPSQALVNPVEPWLDPEDVPQPSGMSPIARGSGARDHRGIAEAPDPGSRPPPEAWPLDGARARTRPGEARLGRAGPRLTRAGLGTTVRAGRSTAPAAPLGGRWRSLAAQPRQPGPRRRVRCALARHRDRRHMGAHRFRSAHGGERRGGAAPISWLWLLIPMEGESSNILSCAVSDRRGIRCSIAPGPAPRGRPDRRQLAPRRLHRLHRLAHLPRRGHRDHDLAQRRRFGDARSSRRTSSLSSVATATSGDDAVLVAQGGRRRPPRHRRDRPPGRDAAPDGRRAATRRRGRPAPGGRSSSSSGRGGSAWYATSSPSAKPGPWPRSGPRWRPTSTTPCSRRWR